MMKTIHVNHPRSRVQKLSVHEDAWIWTQPDILQLVEQRVIILFQHYNGELTFEKGCAFKGGIGRSPRAVLLGPQFKSAHRISGQIHEFAPHMFNLPQDGKKLYS